MATVAIEHRQAELDQFLQEVFGAQEEREPTSKPSPRPVEPLGLDDETVIEWAISIDAKFARLWAGDFSGYPSQSEADQALCNKLAFYLQRNLERMDQAFRRSGLYRKKWDRKDYSDATLDRAIELCKEVFTPPRAKPGPVNGECAPPVEWPDECAGSPPDAQEIDCRPEPDTDAVATTFTPEELREAVFAAQDGDARIFVRSRKDRFCFDHAAGLWFVFDGHYWREDRLNEALAALNDVVELYAKEAERLFWAEMTATKAGRVDEAAKIKKLREAVQKKISCLQKIAWKQGVLQLAASGKDSLGITGDEWDRDPWALPCINGVVNLRDGSLRPGRPEDYFKTVCPHEWRGLDAPAHAYESFQKGITDDEEIPGFKQRLLGSTLPGEVIERIFPILVGPNGQNGKGTDLEAIGYTLGRLAGPIPSEMLLRQRDARNPDAPTSSIMALRGKRIVWASETERGRQFDTQKVKWLTGGDTLVGRDLFGRRQVEFAPSHSVFLLTNDKPRVPASEHAFWARACLIKFPFTFTDNPTGPYEKKRDARLLEKLKAEASGILAWLVRGCLEWQRDGLNPPDSVLEHTTEYRKGENHMARFLEDNCVLGQGMEVKSSVLSRAYRQWCEENGEKPDNKDFTDQIKEQFDYYRKNTGIYYIGLGLLDVPASTESEGESEVHESQQTQAGGRYGAGE